MPDSHDNLEVGPGEPLQDDSSPVLRLVDGADGASQPPVDQAAGDYNLRILQPAFGYVRATFGEDVLREIVHDCGLPSRAVDRKSMWISHQQFEHLLAAVREMVESDEEFMRACAYQFKKQYGPLLLVIRCMSVRGLFNLAERTNHMVCRVGGYQIMDGTRTSVRIRYNTERSESRLACLSRQAAMRNSPTLFMGMAQGKLRESACVAHGDEHCEYDLSWYEPLRLRWVVSGLLIGMLVAALLPAAWAHPALAWSALPLLGALVGIAMEMRRVLDAHVSFSSATALETEQVIRSHSDAMDELTALQYRERDWNRRVEEGVAARTRKLNVVVRRLQSTLRRRTGSFKALEGDDPLTTLANLADDLGSDLHTHQLDAMETAVDRVSRLVGELVDIARADPTEQPLTTEPIEVGDLVARIRRQLKATMIGREVRVTVFQTREAPQAITSVRSMLERILDNLLFNASRHTDRGSIVVEVGGTPGSLLLKLSDTGEGVSKERLEQVFGNERASSGLGEHSSGLSSAARLLDRLGGRLEIMSEPDVGTTLWVYIPIDSSPDVQTETESSDAASDAVGRVVTIRSTGDQE